MNPTAKAISEIDKSVFLISSTDLFNRISFTQSTGANPVRLLSFLKKAERLKPTDAAIGKGGLNIKLASMLTEYTIDVFRELDENVADEDIYLEEFKDEIDGWVIDAIKAIGIDTAKAVLNAPREMLIEKTDLEEETVDEVLRILKSEFEDNE